MLVRYVYRAQSVQKLTMTIAQTGPDVIIFNHGISVICNFIKQVSLVALHYVQNHTK